jgi:hypothetical protein
MTQAPGAIAKTYPQRGPLQQYRLQDAAAFECFRCGQPKKSKLHTIYLGDWEKRLCNGCYGRLLSIYEIKAGTAADDARADALSESLLTLVDEHKAREALGARRWLDRPVDELSPLAARFLGTAEAVAAGLSSGPQLEWSPAVIGLCKATEAELVARLVEPLKKECDRIDLGVDEKDKDLGRVAKYCAGATDRPPELGALAHMLGVAAHSKKRAATSPLLLAFTRLRANWPRSDQLLAEDGVRRCLNELTQAYRNPAAHIAELSRSDYDRCVEFVAGATGLLWRILEATQSVKEVRRGKR